MRRKVLTALLALAFTRTAGLALANEVDDANVAEFNRVTENVGWPTGLGREAKLVKFTQDWTPPADPGKGGGEFFWVVLDKAPLIVKRNITYQGVIKSFTASYRKNRGKAVKAGSEKIVALAHQDLGTKDYLQWVFRPWVQTPEVSRNWPHTKVAGRNFAKPEWALGGIVITAPENVRDFIAAGPKDGGSYAVKIDGNTVNVKKMRVDWLCFHKEGAGWLAKELNGKRPYFENVKVNGELIVDEDYDSKGKPFTLTITPIPEHMPAGW